MVDWQKQARRWQRAFHALQDEVTHGQKVGSRIDPSKATKKKTVKKVKKAPTKKKTHTKKKKSILKQLALF